MTQKDLAKRAKVSLGTIGNVEAGIRGQPRELLAIAAAVRRNPEWLKSGKGPEFAAINPPHANVARADAPTSYERYIAAAQYMAELFPRVDLDRLSRLEPELLAKLEDGLLVAAGVLQVNIRTVTPRRKREPRSA